MVKKSEELVVISLGGSIAVPPEGINVPFLKKFSELIRREVKKGKRFVIIVGGGATCRNYQKASFSVRKVADEDLDWLGIHATRLNAHLLRTIFRDIAHPVVAKNPSRKIKSSKSVLIAAGWRPGASTDYVATRFAKRLKAKMVINISNVDYVYDKDPKKYKGAKPVKRMSWKDYRKMVGDKWDPGLNLPFDPVASKLAQQAGIEVVLIGGKSIKNIEHVLDGKPFRGSILS